MKNYIKKDNKFKSWSRPASFSAQHFGRLTLSIFCFRIDKWKAKHEAMLKLAAAEGGKFSRTSTPSPPPPPQRKPAEAADFSRTGTPSPPPDHRKLVITMLDKDDEEEEDEDEEERGEDDEEEEEVEKEEKKLADFRQETSAAARLATRNLNTALVV
jgi:hypothetical protein